MPWGPDTVCLLCVFGLVLKERTEITREYPSSLPAWLELHIMHTTFQNYITFALWSQLGKDFMKLPQEIRHWVTKHIQPEVPVKTTHLLASEMWNLWNLACFYSSGYLCMDLLSQIFNLVLQRFELCQEKQYCCAMDTKGCAKCNKNKWAVEARDTSSTVTFKKTPHCVCRASCRAHLKTFRG